MQKIVIIKQNSYWNLPFEAEIEFGKLKGFDLYCYYKPNLIFIEVFSHNYKQYPHYRFSRKKLEPKQRKDFDWFDISEHEEVRRDDPVLINIIKKYKPETLKIVEIPNDVKWYIVDDEYGQEFICEDHRTWS